MRSIPYSKCAGASPTHNPFLLTQPIHQQQQFGGSVGGPIIKDRLFYFFTYDGFRRVGRVLYSNTNDISLHALRSNISRPPPSRPTQCPATITAAQCVSAIQFLLNVSNTGAGAARALAQDRTSSSRASTGTSIRRTMRSWTTTSPTSTAPTATAAIPPSPTARPRPTVLPAITSASWLPASPPDLAIARSTRFTSSTDAISRPREPTRRAQRRHFEPRHLRHAERSAPCRGAGRAPHPDHRCLLHHPRPPLLQVRRRRQHRPRDHDQSLPGRRHLQLQRIHRAGELPELGPGAFAGQAGDTDPCAGYHYTQFVQTVDQVNTGNRAGADDFWMKMFDGFAEDNWKIRRNLTVTAGVRYDIQLTPPPTHDQQQLRSALHHLLQHHQERARPRSAAHRASAWAASPGTVVRGGYGLFSGLNQGSTYYAMRVENGVVQVNYNYTGCTASQDLSHNVLFHSGQRPCVSQRALPAHRSAALRRALSQRRHTRRPSAARQASARRASTVSIRISFRRSRTRQSSVWSRRCPATCRSPSATSAPARCGCRSSSTPTSSGRRRTASAPTTCSMPRQLSPAAHRSGLSHLRPPRRAPAVLQHRLQRGEHLVQLPGGQPAPSLQQRAGGAAELHLVARHRHRSGAGRLRHLLRRQSGARSQQCPQRKRAVRHRRPQPLRRQLRLPAAALSGATSGPSTRSTASSSPARKPPLPASRSSPA